MQQKIRFDELIMEYQGLQILLQQYNSTTAGFLIPFLLFALCGAETLLVSLPIQFSHQLLSQPLLLILPLFATYVGITLLGWGYVAGYIHECSKLQLKERWL